MASDDEVRSEEERQRQIAKIVENVRAVFKSRNWSFNEDTTASPPLFNLGIGLRNGQCVLTIHIGANTDALTSFANYPFNVIQEKYAAVLTAINFINWGLVLGNFEMDLRDGEVRFRTAMPISDAVPTVGQISRMVDSTLSMMDRFYSGFATILYTNEEPLVAIKKCIDDVG